MEAAEFSEKIIGSGGRQQQVIELFGLLFPQPLNSDNKTKLMGRLHQLNEIKGVKGQSQHLVSARSQMSFPSPFWGGGGVVEERGSDHGLAACSKWTLGPNPSTQVGPE